MICPLQNKRGIALLEALVAAAIVGILVIVQLAIAPKIENLFYDSREQRVAYHQVNELIEFFRGTTTDQLKTYLAENPINSKLPPYPLCAYINIKDRTNGKTIHRDPLAPPSVTLLDSEILGEGSNRYYQVLPVDSSGEIDRSYCNGSISKVPKSFRFLVNVFFSWNSKRKTSHPIATVSASTLSLIEGEL